jgi:hypothetical protein
MLDSATPRLDFARRATAVVALSLWIGGITFYGAVVVPVGARVLGSATAQGFVTQAVTVRLNMIALVALAALAWNAVLAPRERRTPLGVTWLVMLLAQVALFILHPYVGALLDAATHQVTDHDAFYARHRIYLLVTAAQWLACVVHAGFVLAAWRVEDRGR